MKAVTRAIIVIFSAALIFALGEGALYVSFLLTDVTKHDANAAPFFLLGVIPIAMLGVPIVRWMLGKAI